MRISLTDPRLTAGERRFLRDIAGKLIDTTPRQPLPPEYQRAMRCLGVAAKATATDGSRTDELRPVAGSQPYDSVGLPHGSPPG